MSIDRLRAHYGFERMPFSKDLAPGMLHAHRAHQQAVARISWCVAERQIGVISGECGSGKTVAARAAVAALDTSQAHDPVPRHPGRRVCAVSTRRSSPAWAAARGFTARR